MLKLDNLNVDRPMIVLQRHFIVHLMQFLVGRSSFEEVLMQLINSKCMPCLLYAHLKLVQLIKRKKSHWNVL